MNNKTEHVLIEGRESVIPIEFLEEEVFLLLEEDPKAEIKVYEAIENDLSLDAEYVIESLYDDELICEDIYVPQENTNELQELLDRWCLKTKKSVNMTYSVDRRNEINVVEMVKNIKKRIKRGEYD